MDRWELEKKVVMKALKNPEFKKQLLASPKEALKDFLKNEKGRDLSSFDTLNIKAHEEKKDEWMISIPFLPNNKTLSDAELQSLFAAGQGQHTCYPDCF